MQSNDVNAAAGCNAADARPGMVGLSVDAVRRHRARDQVVTCARETAVVAERSADAGEPRKISALSTYCIPGVRVWQAATAKTRPTSPPILKHRWFSYASDQLVWVEQMSPANQPPAADRYG